MSIKHSAQGGRRKLNLEVLEQRSLLAVEVTRIIEVAPDPRNAPVGQIDILFSEPIDPASFTRADVQLTRNGGDNRINSGVSVAQVSASRFRVSGLTALTQARGTYRFTLNAAGVTDREGKRGTGVASESWGMDLTPPRVLDVINVSPDPRSGNGKPVRLVSVVLSEQVRQTTFDYRDITLTRDGAPRNLINSEVTVRHVGGRTYQIGGLASVTNAGGEYRLVVSAENMRDLAGNAGAGVAVDRWLANDPPRVRLGGTLVYPEESRPLALASGGEVLDDDTPAMSNGRLTATITQGVRTRDSLKIFNRPEVPGSVGVREGRITFEGVVIGVYTGGAGIHPLVVHLNGNATIEATTALLRSINFSSRGEYFRQETRQVEFVLTDGEGGNSRAISKSVLILPVNDAPVLRIRPNTVGYQLNRSGVLLASSATVSDVDSTSFAQGTLFVQLLGGRDNTEQLDIGGAFSVVGNDVRFRGTSIGRLSSNGERGAALLVRFNENATRTIVQQLCRSISFRTQGSHSQATRRIEFLVRDDYGGESNSAVVSVDVRL